MRSILSTSKSLAETSKEEVEGGSFAAPIADLLTIYWVYRGPFGKEIERAILFGPYTQKAWSDPLRFSFSSTARFVQHLLLKEPDPLRECWFTINNKKDIGTTHFGPHLKAQSFVNENGKHTKSMSWVRWSPRPTVTTCELLLTGRISRL